MLSRRRRTARGGFSLMELMVVIAIIGMLATVCALKFTDILGGSMQTKVQADFAVFRQAIDLYQLKTKKHPQRLDDLVTAQVTGKIPNDPWGNAYVYAPPAGSKRWLVTSYGADGVTGGTGDATDLTTDNIDEVLAGR